MKRRNLGNSVRFSWWRFYFQSITHAVISMNYALLWSSGPLVFILMPSFIRYSHPVLSFFSFHQIPLSLSFLPLTDIVSLSLPLSVSLDLPLSVCLSLPVSLSNSLHLSLSVTLSTYHLFSTLFPHRFPRPPFSLLHFILIYYIFYWCITLYYITLSDRVRMAR